MKSKLESQIAEMEIFHFVLTLSLLKTSHHKQQKHWKVTNWWQGPVDCQCQNDHLQWQ